MSSATIQKIIDIVPIENADNLELAKVLGWQCVIRKGEFHKDELVVFVEVDSIVPQREEYEFLRKYNFRVKSQKLRGVLSQGLILHLYGNPELFKIGEDVSKEMEIEHYEKPIPVQMMGMARGNFPQHLVSMTDETRIQSVPEVIDELKNCYQAKIITTKMDGTSATYANKDGDIFVCSRKMSLKITEENKDNLYVKMFYKYDIEKVLKISGNIAIQGEICGPGIQGNRMCFKENKFLVFNVWDIDKQKYFDYSDMVVFCNLYNLEIVPLIQYPQFIPHTMEEWIELAKGKYEGTNNNREGIVVRPSIESKSKVLKGRLSFKVINNEYKED